MFRRKYTWKTAVLEILMLLLSLLVIIPLLVVVLGSFKTTGEAARFNFSIPTEWVFTNYKETIEKSNLMLAFKNSVIITVFVVGITSFICALGSFIIGRRKDKLSRFLNTFFSLGLIVPICVVPTIVILQFFHIDNTKTGLIMVMIATNIAWAMFLFTNFMDTIPRELDEAAFIDGCNTIRLFLNVIMPLLKPVMMTNIVIVGMGTWNDLQTPLYLLNSSKNLTMPLTVYNFKGQYFSEWNLIFADMVLVALPMVLVYGVCQKYIVEGITAGAVKG